MTAAERARARAELRRRAVDAARATTIRALWDAYADDLQFAMLPPAIVDKLRAAFFEGAWRVSEQFGTVAEDLCARVIMGMADKLVAEGFAFEDSPESRRAFGSRESGST